MMRFRRTGVLLILFIASATSLLAQALEPKQVEVYGEKILYFEAGSGPSVILLHGMGANKNQWRSTIPVLAAKFHVYAPDQIGFGTSDKPMINYRIATLVDFLERMIDSVVRHEDYLNDRFDGIKAPRS